MVRPSTVRSPLVAATLLLLSGSGCDPAFPEILLQDAAPDVVLATDADAPSDTAEAADAKALDVPAPMDVSRDGAADTAADDAPDDAHPPDVAPDVAPDLAPLDVPPSCGALWRCGDRCVDLMSSATDCGACGRACATPHGTPRCVGGTCAIEACHAGFASCDADASNGCEADLRGDPNHCGACDNRCSLPNAVSTCVSGACRIGACDAGFADCDGVAANGCETATASSASHCGACGRACGNQNGVPVCAAGACRITCDVGYLDCDGANANGCETHGAADLTHCGRCGNRCAAGQSCVRGACTTDCTYPLCGGACVDLTTNVAHCGACARACTTPNGTPRCVGGTCGIGACNAGFADCDGNASNGCEANLRGDPNHCGACGNRCSFPNAASTCVSGACVLSCNAGHGDCDRVAANGCEVSTLSDPRSCGACGRACAVGGTCVAGSCVCPSGYSDCGGTCRPTGARCSVGVGACLRTGATACAPGGIACGVIPGAPSPEVCNDVDDDCDGAIDEDCGIWHLPYGARRWEVLPLDALAARDPTRRSTHAPREPIRAAFDIESLRHVYVLTANRWHLLDLDTTRWGLPDGQWRASGSLASAFADPDVTAQAFWNSGILHAFSIPADHAGGAGTHEGVEVITRDGAVFYSFDIMARTFSPAGDPHTVRPVVWPGPHAPAYRDVRSSWIDLHNRNGWVGDSLSMACNDPWLPPSNVTVHQMLLTVTTAHAVEAGACFRPFTSSPIGDFPPFRYDGAPPLAMIGDGAFNNDGLWIFRAP